MQWRVLLIHVDFFAIVIFWCLGVKIKGRWSKLQYLLITYKYRHDPFNLRSLQVKCEATTQKRSILLSHTHTQPKLWQLHGTYQHVQCFLLELLPLINPLMLASINNTHIAVPKFTSVGELYINSPWSVSTVKTVPPYIFIHKAPPSVYLHGISHVQIPTTDSKA